MDPGSASRPRSGHLSKRLVIESEPEFTGQLVPRRAAFDMGIHEHTVAVEDHGVYKNVHTPT